MVNAGDAFPAGPDYLVRRIKDLERRVSENASARSLAASQIGSGGLLINEGGSLTISGGGSLNVAGGALSSAGSISAGTTITAGTTINAGGRITGVGLTAGTGSITGASVAVTGAASSATSSVSGSASVGGLLTADAGVSSLDAKTRILASGWSSLWVDTSGRFGQSPSARRYKQDIQPAPLDVAGLLALTPVTYRLKVAVEQFGDAARTEVGLIAEEVETVAPWAIAYDAEGVVQGINYDRLTVALLAIAREQHDRLTDMERRLTALEH
jgi:hypothetical protein